MKQFCDEFWRTMCQYPRVDHPKNEMHDVDACPQCKAALEEAQRDMDIPGPFYTRTDEEKAALDCHGQP